MKWKFWKQKKKSIDETIIQVQAHEAGIKEIFVKAQTSQRALELFHELKKELEK